MPLPDFTVTCLASGGNLWVRDADDNLVFVVGECVAYVPGDSIANARWEENEADLADYEIKDEGEFITVTMKLRKTK